PCSETKEKPADGTVVPQEAYTPETSYALLNPPSEQPSQNPEVPMLSASSLPQLAYDDPAEIVTRIAELLRQRRTYPDAALRRKVEGIVQVALAIAPDGSLASAQLHKKSGSAVLDSAALALVRAIFPLSVRLAKPLAIIVPVEYRLPR
ncbi:MAG: energy transducer TonB, partial [Spirochaetales bacterium]|nr:energy transducer TonB [Spirochaetales bacterium]